MFAVRTVRKGRVKIFGRYFYPSDPHRPYNGELDGGRYAFGLYTKNGVRNGELESFVSLWGSEAEYLADATDEETLRRLMDEAKPTNKSLIDGKLYWAFWNVTKPDAVEAQS